jgi:transposase
MHKRYSLDFKKQVIFKYNSGVGINYIINAFNICKRTLFYWLKQNKDNTLENKTKSNFSKKGKPYKINVDKLNEILNNDKSKDLTLKEMSNELNITLQALFYYFKRNKITFKKNSNPIKKAIQ